MSVPRHETVQCSAAQAPSVKPFHHLLSHPFHLTLMQISFFYQRQARARSWEYQTRAHKELCSICCCWCGASCQISPTSGSQPEMASLPGTLLPWAINIFQSLRSLFSEHQPYLAFFCLTTSSSPLILRAYFFPVLLRFPFQLFSARGIHDSIDFGPNLKHFSLPQKSR